MKIAIVDDERPARSELIFLLSSIWKDVEFVQASNGEEAKSIFDSMSFDVIFLDISLGDISGMTLASYVKKTQENANVIFVTAFQEYAAQAFNLDVVDYITKPFDLKRLEQAAKKVEERRHLKSDEDKLSEKIAVHSGDRILIFRPEEILYVEAMLKNCMLFTTRGAFEINENLSHFHQRLNHNVFYRVQKSYVVNLTYVKEIVPNFNNGYGLKLNRLEHVIIPVSRNEIKNIRQLFTL